MVKSIFHRPWLLLLICGLLSIVSHQCAWYLNLSNPTSHFFDPLHPSTYSAPHSLARIQTAKGVIEEARRSIVEGGGKSPPRSSQGPVRLTAVFLTVQRKTTVENYLETAIGSFLDGLDDESRREVWLEVAVADDRPAENPVLQQAWLRQGVVDGLSVRTPEIDAVEGASSVNQSVSSVARPAAIFVDHFATSIPSRRPGLSPWHQRLSLDMVMALRACLRHPPPVDDERLPISNISSSTAPYCLVMEDDTVLSRNWHTGLASAIDQAEETHRSQWGYVRLFHAEKYFGWERHEIPLLIMGCLVPTALAAILCLSYGILWPGDINSRRGPRLSLTSNRLSGSVQRERLSNTWELQERHAMERTSRSLSPKRRRLPLRSTLVLVLLILSQCILVVLSGRNHIFSVPRGLSVMHRGCCTQGLLYPIDIISALADHLEAHSGENPADLVIDDWLDSQGYEKLAIHPPLMQHIGVTSSRETVEDGHQRQNRLWSFAFERQGPST